MIDERAACGHNEMGGREAAQLITPRGEERK
jgi:hypothetical protein